MGKLITTSKPLILKSKLLCFSLLYIFTSLFLALYTISSQSKQCLFRSAPFDPIQTSSLFSYPSSYGEHKYAISTTRSTCTSSVKCSDYWDVLKEIQHFQKNSISSTRSMRYMQGNADSFGGSFSTRLRFSYFDNHNESTEVPCGFFKKFPISDSDVLDSALILRKHGVERNLFSCLILNELEAFNRRDQLAIAFMRDHMKPKLKLNMFEVEVIEKVTVEYRHNLKPNKYRYLESLNQV